MWLEIFRWTTAIASLIGVILNIKKNRYCFYIWAVTNAAWTVIDLHAGIYAQSTLFFVYFCLAIYGIYEWRRK